MGIFGNRYNREGAGLPMPEGGIRRYLLLLTTHFWKLIGVNLLFVVCSLPVITLPAALCALNRVCMLVIRDGHCFWWSDFTLEFKRSVTRTILPALLFVLMLFAGYYFMSLGLSNAGLPLWCLLFWSAGIGLAIISICWGTYFFCLVSLLDLNDRGIFRNAWLLCMIKPGRAVAILAMIVICAGAAAAMVPLSIPLLITVIPVFVQYSVCFLVMEVAKEYIVDPYCSQDEDSTSVCTSKEK